jgi:hypothetical protein
MFRYCDTPKQHLITTLQALALPAEALEAYLTDCTNPAVLHTELKCWNTILAGRDDWQPTDEQQQAMQAVLAACQQIESVPLPPTWHPTAEELAAWQEACLTTLRRPGWAAVRQASQAALAAFGWQQTTPKPRLRYIRIPDFSVEMTLATRLRQCIVDLECTRVRPGMFYAEGTIPRTEAYLYGFRRVLDLLIAPVSLSRDDIDRLFHARGWERTSVGPKCGMRDRGWSTEAIIDELLCIEIDEIGMLLEKIPAD